MKKLFSYLLPITLKKQNSKINGQLEIALVNGQKVLNAKNCTYSYGILERILVKGLRKVNFDNSTKNILVLGLGGGSIVPIVRETFRSDAHITLVDIDPDIIAIAKNEFDILRFSKITIVCDDAEKYIESDPAIYDLVIVDIFIENVVPEQFTKKDFLIKINRLIALNGILIFNTIIRSMKKEVFEEMKNTLINIGLEVSVMQKVEITNNLLIAKRGVGLSSK